MENKKYPPCGPWDRYDSGILNVRNLMFYEDFPKTFRRNAKILLQTCFNDYFMICM